MASGAGAHTADEPSSPAEGRETRSWSAGVLGGEQPGRHEPPGDHDEPVAEAVAVHGHLLPTLGVERAEQDRLAVDQQQAADLTVTHAGEGRITRSVEACLAEIDLEEETAESRSAALMIELIGVPGVVGIWRPEEVPVG